MSDIELYPVDQLNSFTPSGSGILLIDPHLIPHVAFFNQINIISLTVNGVSIKTVADYLNVLKRKRIPAIFIEITGLQYLTSENVIASFKKFEKVDEDTVSCIEPIKELLSVALNKDFRHCSFVYHIIDVLMKNNLVKSISGLNMSEWTIDEKFKFRLYGREEVRQSIINHKHRFTAKDVTEGR